MKPLHALALSLLVCASALAQTVALMPAPKMQFFDANGAPLAGGYLYTCTAGSTCTPAFVGDPAVNPLATYTDSTGGTANPNPVVLDAAGRASVWLGSGAYKIVLQDASGVAQWTQDNVSSTALTAKTLATGAPLRVRVTTTAAASDTVTLAGVTISSYCVATPSNAAGAALTGVYLVKATNTLQLFHSATAGGTFDLVCAAN